MISASEAITVLAQHKAKLSIPSQARLAFLEKRSIELSDRNEIEPLGDSLGQGPEEVEEEGAMEAEQLDADIADDFRHPNYTEQFAWVGRYVHEIFFWEITLNYAGRMIRLRKSR